MSLWKKRDVVRDLVNDHLACVHLALQAFESATRAYFVDQDQEKAAEYALETHRAEGKADDIRRAVEKAMITGALLPPSRRQVLDLVEHTDTLANAAEASLDRLILQEVSVPEALIPKVIEILDITVGLFGEVECAIHELFGGNATESLACADRIDLAEGKIDRIERDVIQTLFAMDLDLAEKLHVSGYIAELVKISDRAEDLSDRIALIVAERAY